MKLSYSLIIYAAALVHASTSTAQPLSTAPGSAISNAYPAARSWWRDFNPSAQFVLGNQQSEEGEGRDDGILSWISHHASSLLRGSEIDAQDEGLVQDEQHHRSGHVFLIRHGEKGAGSDLSAKGLKRASCLGHLFSLQEHPSTAESLPLSLSSQEEQEDTAHSTTTTRKQKHPVPISFLISQSYRADGRRSRPYRTLLPLARKLGLKIHHECEREDAKCARKVVEKHTAKGENVLLSWQHSALSEVARELGVKGLTYPKSRYDILFHIHNGKVREISSEECEGLDDGYFYWKASKHTKVGGKKLVDDDAWEKGFGED